MDHAHARRPSADEDVATEGPRALRAVPDDLTPAERRDWQALAERRMRERTREGAASSSWRGSGLSATAAQVAAGPAAPRASAEPRRVPHGPRAGHARGVAEPASAPPRRTAEAAAVVAHRPEPRPARPAPRPKRRSAPRISLGASPDRLALWAVVLCLFMALVAAASARGEDGQEPAAVLAPDAPAAQATR